MTSSATIPIFENVLKEVLILLEFERTPEALDITQQARDLLAKILGWENSPYPDDRTATISKVLDVHRRAMEYVSASPHRQNP